jgi:2-methylcitrate dehydratase PrpD
MHRQRFLAAVVVGWDIMYRILLAVRPSAGKRGFHSHGIGAPFGAMATAARLLRLNEGQILHAFGIAGMHSSGTMEYDQTGGEVKRVIAGVAARGGIQAALLAQLGLTGPPTIIEGKRGFLKVFADQSQPEEITRGSRQRLQDHAHLVQALSLRRYSAGSHLHARQTDRGASLWRGRHR